MNPIETEALAPAIEALPQTVDALHSLIAERQAELSARLKLVAVYLVDHPQLVAFSTLAEIAEQAGVHPSTLVRFANYFGFSGFSELQRLYKTQLLEHPSNYRERIRQLKKARGNVANNSADVLLREFIEGNQLALGLLEQQTNPAHLLAAVGLLAESESIYVCGVRRMYPVAVYLNYTLSQMDLRCHLIDGQGSMAPEQMKWLDERSALLAITFNPYGQTTGDAVRYAKQKGAKVVLITDSELCPLASLADQLLIVHEAEVRAFRSLSATLCLAQTLCVALGYQRQEDKA